MELNSQKVRALAPENDPLKIGMHQRRNISQPDNHLLLN